VGAGGTTDRDVDLEKLMEKEKMLNVFKDMSKSR
jgi:hypothetical protein